MWVPLIEKAWAKTIGNYLEADGGIPTNTIHALAGIPVFGYRFSERKPIKNLFSLIKADDGMNYIFSINVHYETRCDITYGHAYSLMGAFSMKDKKNNTYNMIIVRDPWAITNFNKSWNCNDTRWTDDLVAQVPFGIDPRTSYKNG